MTGIRLMKWFISEAMMWCLAQSWGGSLKSQGLGRKEASLVPKITLSSWANQNFVQKFIYDKYNQIEEEYIFYLFLKLPQTPPFGKDNKEMIQKSKVGQQA